MKLLIRWVLNSLFLMTLGYFIPGIRVENFYSALFASLVLGFINALIRPLLILFTLPVNILTLGLFTFVINALLFWLTASVVKGFTVVNFSAAFWGALLLSLFSWMLHILFRSDF